VFIKKSSVLMMMIVISSSAYSNERNNPFIQPKPPKPLIEEGQSVNNEERKQIELINSFVNKNTNAQDPMGNMFQEPNQYIMQGFEYRGSINGVDIYFNPTSKRYVRDRDKIMQITDLNTNLPPMEQVNY
jgi:hypothetical protein